MLIEFEYSIDEIELKVSENLSTTITGDWQASATFDTETGAIDVFNVSANCCAYEKVDGRYIRQPDNYQRIDDMPHFAAVTDAVKAQAENFLPDHYSNPNAEHRLNAFTQGVGAYGPYGR